MVVRENLTWFNKINGFAGKLVYLNEIDCFAGKLDVISTATFFSSTKQQKMHKRSRLGPLNLTVTRFTV